MVNLISIFLLSTGLYIALFEVQIEAFPNVNLDQIRIYAGHPGASPKEIEQLIITPIEQELKSLHGIEKMVSTSFSGTGTISLEINPDAPNRKTLANEIALAIDRADLPNDMPHKPWVSEIAGSVLPIVRIAISATRDDLEMKRLGAKIRNDLLAIDGVVAAHIQGDRKTEYRITIKPEKLRQERISIGEIAEIIKAWNLNSPGGTINTLDGQMAVRIVGEFVSIDDARNLVLRANERGNVLKLGDVAVIEEALENPVTLHDVGGQSALSLTVMKNVDADIIKTVDRVYLYLDKIPARYGEDLTIHTYQDASEFARTRLAILTNNGLVGLALVFITLLFFLRFSVAITTTLGLPIVFMTGIVLFNYWGITLNLISMMGFIMVLGMLVDDAIIIGENITHHMEKGAPPKQAAVVGTMELIGPVTTTILTTVAAFIPMLFMSGTIGKFIIAIPMVVATLLVLSWAESFFILPSHVAHLTNENKHPPEKNWLKWVENTYARLLKFTLKLRWITLILSLCVLAGTAWLAKSHMTFQLFPADGIDHYIVKVEAPAGTSIETMRHHLRTLDRDIRENVELRYLETTLSKAGNISADGAGLARRGNQYGQIDVTYIASVTRLEHNAMDDMFRITKLLSDKYPDLIISATEQKRVPDSGRALVAEINSFDVEASEQAAHALMAWLENVEGVTTIDSSLKGGDVELHAVLDRNMASYAGVDLTTAASHIRAAVGGLVVSSIRRGEEKINVTIRYPEDRKHNLENLRQLLIPNDHGGLIPLHKIARFEKHQGATAIRHKEGIRVATVVADIDPKVITSIELNALVKDNEKQWQGDNYDKLQVSYGGEQEKNQESFRSLIIAFSFALIGIFFILAIQFNNLSYPFFVMLAIPFGAIGIILAFYLHGLYWKPMPLSFLSGLGLVALTGVVVNSSLILLVFVQRAVKDGMELLDAIVLAGRRRIRAVLLTTTTTVVGLLPTAYGWGGLDLFVSPMALALSWGLIFSTFVTLLIVPSALACYHDVASIFKRPVNADAGTR